MGKPFLLQTDNRALVWLQSMKDKNARLTRWSLALQPYTFEIQHRKGKHNANADALSRLPQEPCVALKKDGRNVVNRVPKGLADEPGDEHRVEHGKTNLQPDWTDRHSHTKV